jgi:hypothetical protein
VDHRQPDDEQSPADVSAEVVTQRSRAAADGVTDGIAEGRDRQSHGGAEQDPPDGHGDAGPRSSAGRAAVHDR